MMPSARPCFGGPLSCIRTGISCTAQALELEKAHDEAQLATLHEYIAHDAVATPPTDAGGPPASEGSPQSSGGSDQAGSASAEGAAMVGDRLRSGGLCE